MKRTGWKHLLRSIRKSGVSFLAVAVIAAVSIAIFQGFQSAGAAILNRADRYFNETNLETLEIACANGITQEDIDAIAGWEGVTAAEGGYTDSVRFNTGSERILVQARSLTDTINRPVVLEGALPAAADEVAVEEILAENEGVKVGDTITLENGGALKGETFTVTAVINMPAFSCSGIKDSRGTAEAGLGSNEYYVCLTPDAFDAGFYSDCYTVAYVDSDVLDGIAFYSDEYAEKEAAYLDRLEPLAQERAELRFADVDAEAQDALDEARQTIADAEADIADGERELADGYAELADREDALEAARGQVDTQLAALGLSADYGEALGELGALGAAGAPLRAAIEQVQDGETQLSDARRELADAEQELADGREELADAEQELADAEADAAELQLEDWILSGRENVGDIRGISTIVDAIFGLSYAMALVFLLVATVICFAAITRVIREQRVLIGAQKALGFTSKEIFRHYMMYNIACAVLGIVIGWIISVLIVEFMALHIFVPKFLIGDVPITFVPHTALIAAAICLVIFLGATYLTCARLVRQPAIELLRGEAPVRGKRMLLERWSVYRRLSLYSRTMIKNAFNDKGRLMTTVVGVMGCTALLVACFSMKLGIQNASKTQFADYASYDYRLVVDSEAGSVGAFADVLDGANLRYALIQDKLKNFRAAGGNWETAHVVTAQDPAALADAMRLVDISTGETAQIPDDGVLISRRAAETMDLSEGDVIELMDGSGRTHEATVRGVVEHYLSYHMIVTSEAYYESLFGEAADPCVFLVEGDASGIADEVRGMDGYMTLRDNSEFAANGAELDLVIGICTGLSAVMSVLVLLNQITMYIDRKARELAVMRINGYTMQQTKAYVYKDNVVVIVLGLLAGCVSGVGLAYVDIRIIEAGAEHFVRTPNLIACAAGCAIVAVFALLVNLIALRKIERLNLTNVSSN